MIFFLARSKKNTTGVSYGAETVYPSGAPDFTPDFKKGSCYSILSFICMFCRSLFVCLYFFFWPLCCLFFFDIRVLITPLVSSNSCRYQIRCAQLVSGITFIRYPHNKKIGKPNNLRVF